MRRICLFLVVILTGCGSASTDETSASAGTGSGGTSAGAGAQNVSGASSAAGSAGMGGAIPALPSIVSIDMLGALIGPAKSDGTEWDSTAKVPDEVINGLSTAAGFPEIGPLLSFMQNSAVDALSKPDPFGFAELDPTGAGFDPQYTITLATTQNNVEDEFDAQWPPPTPGWRNVPFHPGVKVRVTLQDEDIANNDDIGKPTINYDDLLEAWKAQDSHWVRVADQTANQVLAVQVQVSGVAK